MGELRKHGRRVKLPHQAFQVLQILVEHPMQVISRDELRQSLWPADTFVEFDHSVNNAVSRLREALGDAADNPRFIETVPRRGYRFIAPVDKPVEKPVDAPANLATIEQPAAVTPVARHADGVEVACGGRHRGCCDGRLACPEASARAAVSCGANRRRAAVRCRRRRGRIGRQLRRLRHDRSAHYRVVAHRRAEGHLANVGDAVQGSAQAAEADRRRTRRRHDRGRLGAARRRRGAHHGSIDRRPYRHASLGAELRPRIRIRRWPTSASWPAKSPASSVRGSRLQIAPRRC